MRSVSMIFLVVTSVFFMADVDFVVARSSCAASGSRHVQFPRKGEYPSMVVISAEIYDIICGGAILSESHVLTTCHCVVDVEQSKASSRLIVSDHSRTQVVAGSRYARTDGHKFQRRWVSRVKTHPNCQVSSDVIVNDFSVIYVTKPFIFGQLVQPVNIPTDLTNFTHMIYQLQNYRSECVVVGWGTDWRISNNTVIETSRSVCLKEGKARFLSQKDCMFRLCRGNRKCLDPENDMDRTCVRMITSPYDTAFFFGDSSSSLVCDGKTVGLLSYSDGCDITSSPLMFTRLDYGNPFFAEFYVNDPYYISRGWNLQTCFLVVLIQITALQPFVTGCLNR